MVCEGLESRFPQARFQFTQAGIASMGSTPGAFRLSRDVDLNSLDLLFVEAAVNDVAAANGTSLGKLAAPLRAALAGRSVTPSVFDMMLVIGREETIARLQDAAG